MANDTVTSRHYLLVQRRPKMGKDRGLICHYASDYNMVETNQPP